MHRVSAIETPAFALRIGGLCASVCVSALIILTFTGCSDLAVALGFRQRLDKVPVTAVQASLVSDAGAPVNALAPGQSANLVLVADAADAKQYITVGAGHGKVDFDNYTLEAQIVSVSAKGVVSLPSDPRVSEGKTPQLTAAPVAHPDVVGTLDIPVRYDVPFVANFSGRNGASGSNGFDGMDGLAGDDAISNVDPDTGVSDQGPGGDGGDGTDGDDGGDGQNGAPGEAVHVWVRLDPATRQLQVKVASATHEAFYRIDPAGGSLQVRANGGAGGAGGRGGQGGRGGSGGNGSPPGNSGLNGQDGRDGRPGAPGAAGTIMVSLDPGAQPYLHCLSWSNKNGAGVPGPAPQVVTEAVGPLW